MLEQNILDLLLTGGDLPPPLYKVQPIIIEGTRKQFIWLEDAYTGGLTEGRYVVRAGDMIVDVSTGLYLVEYVSSEYVPKLKVWTFGAEGQSNMYDRFLGRAPFRASESASVLVDTTVVPFTLVCDSRYQCPNVHAAFIKFFEGSDFTAITGKVISRYKKADGTETDAIPFIPVYNEGNDGAPSSVIPDVGRTIIELHTGDMVTAVVYNNAGTVLFVEPMTVFNTSAVARLCTDNNFIEEIGLKSEYLDKSDPSLIKIPLNYTLASLALRGYIKYRGGRVLELPIDGTRMTIHNLDDYVASWAPQRQSFTLGYTLGTNESAHDVVNSEIPSMTRSFNIMTVASDVSYSVRLMACPVWDENTNLFNLRYFLYNLDRVKVWDVTNKVTAAGSMVPVYDPRKYGVKQELQVALELRDVDASFKQFRYLQNYSITLISAEDPYPYIIDYTTNDDESYGQGIRLSVDVTSGTYTMNFACGETRKEFWLDKVYKPLESLQDTSYEDTVVIPTHFRIEKSNGTILVDTSVDNWNKDHTTKVQLRMDETVIIKWIIRKDGVIYHLAAGSVQATVA